jgi:P27 family predicted phage terminase small subunit
MGGQGSGRTAAPAKLKLLGGVRAGRDSGGRKVETPPPFDDEAPEAPDWLGEYASEVWDLSVRQIVRLKLTKAEDFAALAAYCTAVETMRDATIDIRERGLIHEVTKAGVRWVPRDDPAWNEDDARLQAHPDDDGQGRMGYFAPWPMIERKANPAVAVQNAAMTQVARLGALFGFSPSAMNGLAGLDKGGARGGNDGDASPFAGTG